MSGSVETPITTDSPAAPASVPPEPGAEQGSAVLAAHVDSEFGPAPMAEVLDAAAGDAVEVTTASGAVLGYRIASIEQISKDAMPLEALFARDGEHVLRLIKNL